MCFSESATFQCRLLLNNNIKWPEIQAFVELTVMYDGLLNLYKLNMME